MRTERQVLEQLRTWGEGNEVVRAAVLTSSRVDPKRETDFLSDYDVELYVADLEPFRTSDQWLDSFGSVMVRWPYKPRPTTSDERRLTRLVLFKDGVRIDFQITDRRVIEPDAYDDGYYVLFDKDNLTAGLGEPTFSTYITKKPSREAYETIVHEFWWNATYVPKSLWRDELPFAAMMGQQLRDKYLRTVIEWYLGVQHGWSLNPGTAGRWFKRYLDRATWSEYESTFAETGIEQQWDAFYNAIALFRRLAVFVGDHLGYEYPHQMDQDLTAYFGLIRSTKRETGNKRIQRTER